MPIRDLKNKIDRLENLLNAKAETPAEWALEIAKVDPMPVKQYRVARTEKEILERALSLTETYGTKENYIKAIANAPPVDLSRYKNPEA